jgi:hypothetical protein
MADGVARGLASALQLPGAFDVGSHEAAARRAKRKNI